MRITVLICALIVAATGSTPAFADQKVPTAFVGSFVSIVQIECDSGGTFDPETGEEEIHLCMDSVYEARYRVEKVLEGKLVTDSEVTFIVADHYGFPRFAEQQHALVFLDEYKGRYYHIKYEWAPAFKTNDGEYAKCGCSLDNDRDMDTSASTVPYCRSLLFSPPVSRDLTHASRYVIDALRTGLEYKVEGNRAECIRGVLVEDLYKKLRPGLIESINH